MDTLIEKDIPDRAFVVSDIGKGGRALGEELQSTEAASVVGCGCQLKEAFSYQANTQGETEHEQRKEETRGFHIHCESGERINRIRKKKIFAANNKKCTILSMRNQK